MSKSKVYTVYFNITLDMELFASSIEEAIEKAKEHKVVDFIEFQGRYNRSRISIFGISEDS